MFPSRCARDKWQNQQDPWGIFAPVYEDAPSVITVKPSNILSGFVVAALILSGCKQEKAPPLAAAGPPQVVVAAVEQRDVP
ncbi:MAG TPA: hypothetical protein VKG63_05435, partial [Steroidobacteraceae bacterium]|nr:hypothetical protein [Steroidobacteraceae bacterium]